MLSISIEHDQEDRARVLEVETLLEGAGLHPQPGSGGILLVCVSTAAIERIRRAVSELIDVLLALERGRDQYVIPVRFDDCFVPKELARLGCIGFFEPEGRDVLVEAVLQVGAALSGSRICYDLDHLTLRRRGLGLSSGSGIWPLA